MSRFTGVITSGDEQRDLSLDSLCQGLSLDALLAECRALDDFRRNSDNLYQRVRAVFFLYAIHRFHIPRLAGTAASALIPYAGFEDLLDRRFEEAIEVFIAAQAEQGASASLSSALAASYRALGFQTLADQVRRSVRSVRGNQWMFRAGHTFDYPLGLRPELLAGDPVFPILREATPVRMDFSHSGWSDIFFLGMDFPEGARVINVSIDLAVRGANQTLRSAPASGRGLVPRDRSACHPLDQRRSAGLRRRFFDCRSLRLCARLPGSAEGGRDRQRHRSLWDGRVNAAAGRSAGAPDGNAGLRH